MTAELSYMYFKCMLTLKLPWQQSFDSYGFQNMPLSGHLSLFLLQDYFDRKRFSFFVFIADQVHPNERVDPLRILGWRISQGPG